LAKVKNPDLAKIDRLGPDIDFYYWKGIPVVRKMPKKFKPIGTEAQKATWAAMKYAHDQYQALPVLEREAYKVLTTKSQMSNRDFVTKLCLKNYPDLGEKYSSWRVSFEPQGGGITKVFVSKAFPSDDIVSCMTYNETVSLLQWLEINPNLRGKKFRRRWDLKENIEDSHNSFIKSAIGGESSLLDVFTDVYQPMDVCFRNDELFVADQIEGFKAFKIVADALVLKDTYYDGGFPTFLCLVEDYILVGKYNGGLYVFSFDGSSLTLEYEHPGAPRVYRIVEKDGYIFVAQDDGGVAVYTLSGSTLVYVTGIPPYDVRTLSVEICGKYVVTAERDDSLLLYSWKNETLTLLDSFYLGAGLGVWADDSFIAAISQGGVLHIFSPSGGKLTKITSKDFGDRIYGVKIKTPYILNVMLDGFLDMSYFNGNDLFTVFTNDLYLTGRYGDFNSGKMAISCYRGSIRLYEYELRDPFGYDFEAKQVDGDEFLCIKSDPNDSSSFGLSGLYAIPY